MKDNPMQWSQTVPNISRLDYFAMQLYIAYLMNENLDSEGEVTILDLIREAKRFIDFLDKEQNHE